MLSFIRSFYSDFAMLGSTADQTKLWTISQTESIVMVGDMLIINARYRACPTDQSRNLRLNDLFDLLMLRLPPSILGKPVYFRLYKFALRMWIEPV